MTLSYISVDICVSVSHVADISWTGVLSAQYVGLQSETLSGLTSVIKIKIINVEIEAVGY